MSRVLVRFADDGEIIEGEAPELDLDRSDFELIVADPDANHRRALIPLPSVKCLTMGRRHLDDASHRDQMPKVAVRFRDGEVIKGLVSDGPHRGRFGVTVELLSRDEDEVEILGIPYQSLKAVFYLKSWDSRPAEFSDATGRWTGHRDDAPLVDLLSRLRALTDMRDRGLIDGAEFEARRRSVLDHF